MMEAFQDGAKLCDWPVSTARAGHATPTGEYAPQFLSEYHRSSLCNNAPMPFSIFYDGNYVIHGTDQESKLGRPASAGGLRLSRANAEILFSMVQTGGWRICAR